MRRYDILNKLVENGNGYLFTAEVLEKGVSKPVLAEYTKKQNMERVAHGVYLAQDAWLDELYVLSHANGRLVFSHESALMLNGLMEREPSGITVTVPAGYNATHLRKKGICVHQAKTEITKLGITELETAYGNAVRAYNRERTICDIIRAKDSMDIQVFRYAMREYMASDDKNLIRLMEYAGYFGIESAVRTYTEVML